MDANFEMLRREGGGEKMRLFSFIETTAFAGGGAGTERGQRRAVANPLQTGEPLVRGQALTRAGEAFARAIRPPRRR